MPAHAMTTKCNLITPNVFASCQIRTGRLNVLKQFPVRNPLGVSVYILALRLTVEEIGSRRNVSMLRKLVAESPGECLHSVPMMKLHDGRKGTATGRYCQVHVH
jgi:hypothetical protein